MKKGFEYLLKNLSDSVFEMMLKLGEERSSGICIYYTEDLLSYLIGEDDVSSDKLIKFKDFVADKLGKIDMEIASDGRYGLRVYSDEIDKITKSNPRRVFLRELIDKIRDRNCTIDEIKNIFEKESADYVCEEINDSEFQYVIYFRDANIDEYKYCFTFDIMGSYYHRLIDYDFETIIHHNCNVGH